MPTNDILEEDIVPMEENIPDYTGYGLDVNMSAASHKSSYQSQNDTSVNIEAIGQNKIKVKDAGKVKTVKGYIDDKLKTNNQIVNLVYPIGSIYISVLPTNPGSLMGGSWTSFGTGRTLVGLDITQTEFQTAEKTGGSKYLQSHTHQTLLGQTDDGNWTGWSSGTQNPPSDGPGAYGGPQGGAHNRTQGNGENLQPYITVYMFKRVS